MAVPVIPAKALKVLGETDDRHGSIKSGFTSRAVSRRTSISAASANHNLHDLPTAHRSRADVLASERLGKAASAELPRTGRSAQQPDALESNDHSLASTPFSTTFSESSYRHGTNSSVASSGRASDSRSTVSRLAQFLMSSRKPSVHKSSKSSFWSLRDRGNSSAASRRASPAPEPAITRSSNQSSAPSSPVIREWFDRVDENTVDPRQEGEPDHPLAAHAAELDSREVQPMTSATIEGPPRAFSNAQALSALEAESILRYDSQDDGTLRPPRPSSQFGSRTISSAQLRYSVASIPSSPLAKVRQGTSILSLSDSDSDDAVEQRRVQRAEARRKKPKHSAPSIVSQHDILPDARHSFASQGSKRDSGANMGRRLSQDSLASAFSNAWVPPTDAHFLRRTKANHKHVLSKENVQRLGTQRYMAVTTEEARLLASMRQKRAELHQMMLHDVTMSQLPSTAASSSRNTTHQPVLAVMPEDEMLNDCDSVAADTQSIASSFPDVVVTPKTRSKHRQRASENISQRVSTAASHSPRKKSISSRLATMTFPAPPQGAIPYNKPLPPKPRVPSSTTTATTLVGAPLSPLSRTFSATSPVSSSARMPTNEPTEEAALDSDWDVTAAGRKLENPRSDDEWKPGHNKFRRSSTTLFAGMSFDAEARPASRKRKSSSKSSEQRAHPAAFDENRVSTQTSSEPWDLATPRASALPAAAETKAAPTATNFLLNDDTDEDDEKENQPAVIAAVAPAPELNDVRASRRQLMLPRLVQEDGTATTQSAPSSNRTSTTATAAGRRSTRMSRLPRAEGFIIRS